MRRRVHGWGVHGWLAQGWENAPERVRVREAGWEQHVICADVVKRIVVISADEGLFKTVSRRQKERLSCAV